MSIEQTKLFKKRVETPELRTNELFINNINMTDILFGATQTITNDARKTLEERGDIVNDTNPEQVLGFRLPITEDLIDMPLISLTLRREDTVGTATALGNFVYAYVDCFNERGDIVHTFYSFNPAKQQANDGLKTTWHFVKDNIISEFYKKIEFRFTTTQETRGNATVRSTNMMKSGSSSKLYIQGWDTMYPNQEAGREWQTYTSDVSISFQKQYPSIQGHLENEEIHVTAAEKDKWNNIVIPEIPEIPEQIVYQPGNNVAISDDNVISVITTDVVNESDMIPTSKAVHEIFYETHQFNNYDSSKYTYLPDTVGTIVLSKKHFISGGKITKVRVPHGNTQEDLTNGQGGFLVIDVFKEDNSYPEGYNINSPSHRFLADEYYAYKNHLNEGHYEWTFNERDCIIPDDYKVVHLSLVVDEANVSKVGVGSATNAKFRINCLAKNGNRDEGVVYEEDDECKLYWQGGANGANRIAIVEVEYEVKTLDVSKIAGLSSSIENHISSDVHLSSSDKTNISKVSQLETSLKNHTVDDTHVTTDEKDLLQTLVVPQTRLFSTKTDTMTTDEYANCLYFSISKKHFTQGKLQKIEIPYKSGGSVYSKVWLCLQFYNSATEVKTFEDCIFSKNYQNQTNTGGTLVFEFDNVQIPYQYSFVKIMLAQNSTPNSEEPPTTLPSGNVELRVTPLKTTTLTFDLDECEVKGKNGTIYNWLVYLNAETKISFLDEYSLLLQEVKELKNRIEQLESNS